MYEEIRTAIEVISAIMCFILLRFMIKPYEITGESRYLGLPLGFGFLGVTHAISAFAYYMESYLPIIFSRNIFYIQLIARTFAFLFIAITYYFSKKPNKNSRLTWKISLILFIALLLASLLIVSIPDLTIQIYRLTRSYLRVFNLIIILYICTHTFRSHIAKPDPKTIWIPLGYVFLAVSQYSLLLWQFDGGIYAFFAGLIFRLIFLSVFLIVTYGSFYQIKKRSRDEDRT
jgi:hypothetical protein